MSEERSPELKRPHVVVCVDDSEPVLMALQRSLWREPYELVTWTDPKDALQWMRGRDVSLVITDQRMPSMSGTEFAEEVARAAPATACALLTAFPESVPEESAADAVIPKPWDDEDLRRTIRGLLRSREAEPGGVRVGRVGDLAVRVDCGGLTGIQVMNAISQDLARLEARSGELAILLDRLECLADSVTLFLGELSRALESSGARIIVLDRSGCAARFRREMGGTLQFDVPPVADAASRRRVLVAGRHVDERTWLGALVEALGHEVKTVSRLEEALDSLDAGWFDLVLVEGTGIDVVRAHMNERGRSAEVLPIPEKESVPEIIDLLDRLWRKQS